MHADSKNTSMNKYDADQAVDLKRLLIPVNDTQMSKLLLNSPKSSFQSKSFRQG